MVFTCWGGLISDDLVSSQYITCKHYKSDYRSMYFKSDLTISAGVAGKIIGIYSDPITIGSFDIKMLFDSEPSWNDNFVNVISTTAIKDIPLSSNDVTVSLYTSIRSVDRASGRFRIDSVKTWVTHIPVLILFLSQSRNSRIKSYQWINDIKTN